MNLSGQILVLHTRTRDFDLIFGIPSVSYTCMNLTCLSITPRTVDFTMRRVYPVEFYVYVFLLINAILKYLFCWYKTSLSCALIETFLVTIQSHTLTILDSNQIMTQQPPCHVFLCFVEYYYDYSWRTAL